MDSLRRILLLVLIFVPDTRVESGTVMTTTTTTTLATIRRSTVPGILSRLVWSLSETITNAIHLIGGVIPLRGFASIAADVGIPGAVALQSFLTPTKENPDKAEREAEYLDLKDKVYSTILAAFGKKPCLLRVTCLGGKGLSSSISGASAVTLLLSTIANRFPEAMTEVYATLKNSMFYSDDCRKYECRHDDLTFHFVRQKLFN